MATTTQAPWQAQIIDQLGTDILTDPRSDATHAAVFIPTDPDAAAMLLGRSDSEIAAVVLGEDKIATLTVDQPDLVAGEVRVVKLEDLYRWHRAHAAGEPEPDLAGPTIEPRRQNVETDEPDHVDVEENDDQPVQEPQPPEPASIDANLEAAGDGLFDAADYDREDLQIPKIDGQSIDRIKIKFSGEIHLNRSDPSDVKLYNALRFGKDVALLVEGRCNATGAKGETDREGDLDVIVGQKSLKLHSISKPAGADWVVEA